MFRHDCCAAHCDYLPIIPLTSIPPSPALLPTPRPLVACNPVCPSPQFCLSAFLLSSVRGETKNKLKAGESQDCVHLVSSHANDVGLTALHLDPLPRGPARADVAETFYLVDLADSALAAELKEAGKAVVYQVCTRRRRWVARLVWLLTVGFGGYVDEPSGLVCAVVVVALVIQLLAKRSDGELKAMFWYVA